MTNRMVQEALFREHQQAMQRAAHDAHLAREARLAPQPVASQTTDEQAQAGYRCASLAAAANC